MTSHILSLLVDRIFFLFLFGISYSICIVWSYGVIFLDFLLLPIPSDLLLLVVSFILIVLLCFVRLNIFSDFFLCLSIFVCCHRFLICVSSLISHSGFEFLFVFLRGTLILSKTNFSPALISSFNSVMFFVKKYINNPFSFSVSTSTFFQSWFLRDCNVVFFSNVILFKIS